MKRTPIFAFVRSRIVLAGLMLAAGLISSQADPSITGIWVSATPAPDGSYVENILWQIYPTGELDEHWQHTLPGKAIIMNSKADDIATYPTLYQTSDGQITETEQDRSTRTGNYVLSADSRKMIVKFDDTSFAFLFLKYGDIQDSRHWNGKLDESGPYFEDANFSDDLSKGAFLHLGNLSPAHSVDPAFVGSWISSGAPNGNAPVRTSLWMIAADGTSTLHVQNVTLEKPLAPENSSQDIQTLAETLDAFGGRFVMVNPGANSRDTGIYTLGNGQMTMTFDKGGNSISFKRYADATSVAPSPAPAKKHSWFPF